MYKKIPMYTLGQVHIAYEISDLIQQRHFCYIKKIELEIEFIVQKIIDILQEKFRTLC